MGKPLSVCSMGRGWPWPMGSAVCLGCAAGEHRAGQESSQASNSSWDMQNMATGAGKMSPVLCLRVPICTALGRACRQEEVVRKIYPKAFRSDKWQIPTTHIQFSFGRNGVGSPPDLARHQLLLVTQKGSLLQECNSTLFRLAVKMALLCSCKYRRSKKRTSNPEI